jgi:uncharacterized protein
MSIAAQTADDASLAGKGAVTVVTQTRVRPECTETFARWQAATSGIIDKFPGFIDQKVMPPSPPAQDDWVIVQRFTATEAALAWLRSEERLKRVEEAAPMLVGRDDVHIVDDARSGVLPAPVSAVISTRVKAGLEDAYRAWERRIAVAQSRAPGFQGYRFEPPMPGVQDDWLAIVRFDGKANLQAWLDSPERRKLLDEAAPFTEEYHARIARTGFDQWFSTAAAGPVAIPAWKQNMLVVLMLYPVVFLFGVFVANPLLLDRLRLPFAIALFIGNVVSVVLLSYLVPRVGDRLSWWLQPSGREQRRTEIGGTLLLIGLYALMMLIFWRVL